MKIKRIVPSRFLLCAILLCAVSVSANAAIIASEAFDYTDGPLTGNNGGTGWSGAFTDGGNSLTVASSQIDESGGPGEVGINFRGLSTIINLTNIPGGEVWMGFDGQIELVGSYGFGGISPFQGTGEKGIIGAILGRDWFSVWGNSTSDLGSGPLRIVVKFDLNTHAIELWNGTIGSTVDVGVAPLHTGNFNINGTDNLRFSLNSTNAGGSIQIDNFVLATTAVEVVTAGTIKNPSFENWSATGDYVGANDLDDWFGPNNSSDQGAQLNTATASSAPVNYTVGIDGEKFAFINKNNASDNWLAQNTGENFISGETYYLTVGVGRRQDHDDLGTSPAHWKFGLYDAQTGDEIATLDGLLQQGDGGVFTDRILQYVALPEDDGKEIQVRLSAIDVGSFSQANYDNVRLATYLVNQPPQVNAGNDMIVYENVMGNTVVLQGQVQDDGVPLGGSLASSWELVSGPNSITYFPSPNVNQPDVTFSDYGIYTLELTATDSELTAKDTVLIDFQQHQCSPLVGDFNGDCIVDLRDFSIFASDWLE